jgi:3-phenylpropionate/trans-cinnamate dioxygenase ferredoxin component
MAEWIKVGEVGNLAPGQVKVIIPRGERIALANLNGEYFALDDACTHDFAPLDQGELVGDQIECPRHGARFDVRTGKAMTLPAIYPIKTFPTRVVGNDIEIEV